MKSLGTFLLTMIYNATIISAGILWGMKAVALIVLASCCVAASVALIERPESSDKLDDESED